MPKIPILSGDIIVKVLEKIGYFRTRQRGSHIRLKHETRRSVTVPVYKTIGKGLLRKILRDGELTVEEFVSLMGK
ncbi:MAG TPA: type II toxin-antitoxin system HicA family toxin [Candidatus Paceibacterota bacterium]|nr:MAG: YcfA family protein [Parcubacteria group bacterium GW2011_GWB1_44_7]